MNNEKMTKEEILQAIQKERNYIIGIQMGYDYLDSECKECISNAYDIIEKLEKQLEEFKKKEGE